jgi:cytoskeletal protein CcmA (bactofilin family)
MSSGIGKSIRVKGEVSAREPFLVAGQVEGTVIVDGHALTVAEGATVAAIVTAETVVIQGTVNGATTASGKIVVQQTAKVDGELSAPSISIAEGASIHGRVETTQGAAKLKVAS